MKWTYVKRSTGQRQLGIPGPDFAAINIDEIEAGNMAVKHTLRGLNAIHLVAALTIQEAEDSL
jgi:hypothetical protein